ncbi:MAG: glutathione peroxidase [Acidobacteria bacterium]|nr:glutathione peroxidase [Acidobacteriota bacterium]
MTNTLTPLRETDGSLYALTADALDGSPVPLSTFDGRVTLVVNTASACGFTPQYAGLQRLHDTLADRGFAVLGFPSNDFGAQEPGTADEIATFCSGTYDVRFPLFAKVVTRDGPAQSSVYRFLGSCGRLPSWNFGKYVVGRDGRVKAYFSSRVAPDDETVRNAIDAALDEPPPQRQP